MKKILLALLMFIPLCLTGCGCNKFDINTYSSAVKNFKNSTGYEFKLVVTTKEAKKDYYLKEESVNKYVISTTGKVTGFFSELKEYKILTYTNGPDVFPSSPSYTLNRYYKGEINKFYFNERIEQSKDIQEVKPISYEDKYNDVTSRYYLENVVPVFSKEIVSKFNIAKLGKGGSSIATFEASCPAYLKCDNEVIEYSVSIDRNFYFSKIEFSVVSGAVTKEFKYEFTNYNSDVKISYPSELENY